MTLHVYREHDSQKEPPPMRALIFLGLLALGLVYSTFATGCSAVSKGADTAKQAVIDCGTGELAKVAPIAIGMAPAVIDGSVSMDAVESAAIAMGYRVGGCLLRHLVDAIPKMSGVVGPTPIELALHKLRTATETDYLYRTASGTL